MSHSSLCASRLNCTYHFVPARSHHFRQDAGSPLGTICPPRHQDLARCRVPEAELDCRHESSHCKQPADSQVERHVDHHSLANWNKFGKAWPSFIEFSGHPTHV